MYGEERDGETELHHRIGDWQRGVSRQATGELHPPSKAQTISEHGRASSSKHGPNISAQSKEKVTGRNALNFLGAVNKGLNKGRHISVTEEEWSRLAKIVKDWGIIVKEVFKESSEEWQNSLVGKFLGSKIPIETLRELIKDRRPLSGNVQVLDLTNDYYYIKFEAYKDTLDVWKGSPWIF